MNKITYFLKSKRMENNKQIKDVAYELGISAACYSTKERCIYKFDVDELKKIKSILNLKDEEIIDIFLS